MRTISVALLICVALLLLDCSYYSIAGQQRAAPIGIVRSVTGGWTLQGHMEPITAGQFMFQGDVPSITRSTHARLVIGLESRADPWERECTAAMPCEGPYSLPGNGQGTGLLAFVRSYWGDSNKRPAVFAGARDATRGPEHALLVIGGSSIAVNPALSQFAAGQYRLVFTPLESSAARTQVNVSWHGDSTVVPAVAPGFYALDAYSSDGEHVGTHAAVLVVPSSDTVVQQRWQQDLMSIRNMAGTDVALSDQLRLVTVLALKDGALH